MPSDDGSKRPEWWDRNQNLKQSMDLPEYAPPRFEDGTYLHSVTDELETEYECSVRIVGIDPRYPDDWEVQVNGKTMFEVGRHRDDNGNTVYELTADEFRRKFRSAME